MNMSYPSQTRMSKCYYCKEEMKDENLKLHCEKKHNAVKRVAGQTSLLSHFAVSAKKFKPGSSSLPPSDELLLLSGGRETPELNLFSRPETPLENLDDNEERDDTFKELIRIVKNIYVNSGQSLQEIKMLKENVTSLESKMKKNIPEFAKPDDVIPTDERIVELRKCDSVQDIIETFSELVFEIETVSILCELCFVKKEEQAS